MIYLLPLFTLFLLLFEGCVVYRPIDPATVPRVKERNLTKEPVAWWTLFHDQKLDRAVEKLLEKNYDLLAARSRILQATIAAAKTEASLYPSLDLKMDAKASRLKNEEGDYADIRTLSAALGAGYELDLWGRLENLNDAARHNTKAQVFDYQTMAIILTATLINNWYALSYTREYIRYLEKKIALAKKESLLMQHRYRAQRAKWTDLLLQRSALKQMESELTTQQIQMYGYRDAIARLLSQEPIDLASIEQMRLPDLTRTPIPQIDSTQMMRRPDIAAELERLKALDRRAAAAVSAQYPRFSLNASIGQSDLKLNNIFELWYASILGSLSAPIFDGGSRRADARLALERRDEQLLKLKKSLLNASIEIRNALQTVRIRRRNLDILRVQLQLDEKKVISYRNGYFHGTEDFKRFLEAKMTLISTRLKLLRAKLDLITAYVTLYRTTAAGWRRYDNNQTTRQEGAS